jgi:class 3 adenylate cyclase
VSRWLGLLAWTLSRWEDAERHFEDAIAMNTRIAAPPLVARAQLEYAEMLLERNQPEDRDKALDLLNRSLDTARQLDMKMVLEKALALKLEAQGADMSDTKHSIYAIAASIGNDRPDLGAHAAADGSVTLMFSDMEGFTAMTERLGDAKAHAIVQEHHAIVREQTAEHKGHEVELRGDGFLLAFAEPLTAVRCATALHRAFADYSEKHPEEPIRVRIGLHTGEAIKDADKFFGKTVIQAFRLADLAKGAETLVSSDLKAMVERADDLRFDDGREVELKGISGTHRVFAVEWA